MSRPVRLLVAAGAVAGVAAAGYLAYGRYYAGPAAALRDDIDALERSVRAFEDALMDGPGVEAGVRGIAQNAVGGDPATLEHRIRTAFQAIGDAAGLADVEVNSRAPERRINPAGRARLAESGFRKLLGEQVDATTIRADLEGRGTWRQALDAIALAQAQPWLLGPEAWSIRPIRGETAADGSGLFTVSLSANVLVLDEAAAPSGEIALAGVSAADAERVQRLVGMDPFRAAAPPPPPPPPPPVVAERPSPPPPPPPAVPGAGWTLTGVIRGSSGEYAIVVHADGRQRMLRPGDAVDEVVYRGGSGEVGTFEVRIGDTNERYTVRNGQSLAHTASRERR
ncbi:MAG: hypothetical protein AAFX79_06380 [Planctomycetota bacterium]